MAAGGRERLRAEAQLRVAQRVGERAGVVVARVAGWRAARRTIDRCVWRGAWGGGERHSGEACRHEQSGVGDRAAVGQAQSWRR